MQGDKKSGVVEHGVSMRLELLKHTPAHPGWTAIILALVQDFFARAHSGPLLDALRVFILGFQELCEGELTLQKHRAMIQSSGSPFKQFVFSWANLESQEKSLNPFGGQCHQLS